MPDAILSGRSNQKLMGLEVVRFVSAVAVLFWHYQNFWYVAPDDLQGFVREQQPLYHLLSPFYEFGRYGVQVFWSISGYIFFWKYRETLAAGRMTGAKFFLLRFSRLYPLHFATLLLVCLLQVYYIHHTGYGFVYQNDDLFHFVLQLFMASNWGFQHGASFNGPIWSISIEVLIYIGFFWAMRILGAKLWVPICVAVAAAVAHQLSDHNPIWQCVVCFFVGGTVATVASMPVAQTRRIALRNIAVVLLLVVPVILLLSHAYERKAVMQVAAIGYVAVLLYVMAEHVVVPQKFHRVVEAAGNMTYSSYLIHFPIQLGIAIVCLIEGWAIPKESPVFLLSWLSVVLVLAVLVYRWFEMPAQKWVRSFGAVRKVPTAAASISQ